jgi:hypothetical protein
MGVGPFNNINLKPLDIIRTVVIVIGHFVYYFTVWQDWKETSGLFWAIFGQLILSIALIMSILDNLDIAPKLPRKIYDAMLRFFDWVQGYNRKK